MVLVVIAAACGCVIHKAYPNAHAVLVLRSSALTPPPSAGVISQLGFKTAVGMPFKDIATSDSVYLEQLPAADDKNARTALRRMQEVRFMGTTWTCFFFVRAALTPMPK